MMVEADTFARFHLCLHLAPYLLRVCCGKSLQDLFNEPLKAQIGAVVAKMWDFEEQGPGNNIRCDH